MLNKAQVIGHLGADPEERYTQSGESVCNFRVATTERYTKDGEKKEQTEWHQITAFRKLAEICSQYLKKGSLVYVEGKLTTRKYTDRDGIERYATSIVASEMKMLGGNERKEPRQAQQNQRQTPKGQQFEDAPFDDDVPF